MEKTIIEFDSVSREYGGNFAIAELSFKINSGERVMLLGTNGAGKTTTLKLLLGLENTTSGNIKLQNKPPTDPKSRQNIGVMLQESGFISELTTLETLNFIKNHYKEAFSINELSKIFMLDSFKNKYTCELSLGQKRRLALALAFLNKPKIIFLDEPTVGLDVESRSQVLSFIRDYCERNNATLLLTTHYLEEADRLVKRIIYLQNGKIQKDCSIEEFKSRIMQTQIQFFCDMAFDEAIFNNLISHAKKNQNKFILLSEAPDQVVRCLVKNNIPFYDLKILAPSLELAYLTLREKENHVAQSVY